MRSVSRRFTTVGSSSGRSVDGALFSDAVWQALAQSLKWSRRECQIVPAIIDDLKETAIATRLGISRHTVHTHTERLYRKMGVTSRVGLARRILIEYVRLADGEPRGLRGRLSPRT
jgi:DNA-binding NarL/FixJ family response regulator